MEWLKKFLSTKSIGWYVSAVSCLFALIAVIVYGARGGNYLSPVSGAAVALMVVGVVINAAVLVKDFKLGGFIPVVLYACAIAVLLNTEMLFITNVAFGVDGNYFDGAFFTFLIFIAVATIGSAVAFGMGLSKKED